MKLHEHIAHHVYKHKEKIVAHIYKHHKKYIVGAGIASGMAVYKIIGAIALFFGMTYMGGGSIGADYYDAEYYAQEEAKKISISSEPLIEETKNNTGCTSTGTQLSGTIQNCTGDKK